MSAVGVATSRAPRRASSPTRTAMVLFAKELLRRWPTLLVMVALPSAYFLISYATDTGATNVRVDVWDGNSFAPTTVRDRDYKALYLAVLGISVSGSFAALTTVRGSIPVMRRLRLVGFRAHQLLSARLAVLLLITLTSAGFFLVLFQPLSNPASFAGAAGALVMVGLIAVAIGTLIGLLIPREFEAAMAVITLAGMQMALGRGGADAERYLPYWPAVEALKGATFGSEPDITRWLGLGLLYAITLLLLAYFLWVVRTRIWRQT